MKKMIRKQVIRRAVLLGIGIFLLSGCTKQESKSVGAETEQNYMRTDSKDVYQSTIDSFKDGQKYTYLDMGKNSLPILLVTEDTYVFEKGVNASLRCDVYYAWDGKAQKVGSAESQGTAYPVRFSDSYIYVSGPHSISKYEVNNEKQQLVLNEYADEVFDTESNTTYTYVKGDDEKYEVEDDSKLNELRDEYNEATVVSFDNK